MSLPAAVAAAANGNASDTLRANAATLRVVPSIAVRADNDVITAVIGIDAVGAPVNGAAIVVVVVVVVATIIVTAVAVGGAVVVVVTAVAVVVVGSGDMFALSALSSFVISLNSCFASSA